MPKRMSMDYADLLPKNIYLSRKYAVLGYSVWHGKCVMAWGIGLCMQLTRGQFSPIERDKSHAIFVNNSVGHATLDEAIK